MVEKRWRIPSVVPGSIRSLAHSVPCSPLLAGLLHRRGIADPESAKSFLYPKLTHLHEPQELPDMEVAVARIERALRERQSVVIFGDYDVDGITSTCLLKEFFDLVGMPVRFRLPNRLLDGYGIRSDAVREIAAEGAQLIITVDNGSSAREEVELARELGVDVVVTDHHQAPEVLPRAVAVVNPCRLDSTYPFRHLAGVGVVFKLVWALAQRFSRQRKLSEEFRNFLLESLALVALGTISDVVPLLGENRVLAKYGLVALEKTRRPGLRLLVDSILNDRELKRLDSSDVAFRIGPRLNAAGRLGQAESAIRLLMAQDAAEARSLAGLLERENRRRQKIEQEIFASARDMVEQQVDLSAARAIVLAGEGWHPGVIGIVAARLTEEYFRPTLLVSLDGERCRGSARSIPGVHITNALAACSDCLVGFGGHERAAGVEVCPERLGDLRAALNEAIPLSPAEMVPEIDVDAAVRLSDISRATVDELSLLAPHGSGNPEPILSVENIDIVGEPRLLGESGRHLAFHVRQSGPVFRAIAFGKGEYYSHVSRRGARVSLLLEPQVSRWQGREGIELNVLELRVL